LTRRSNFKELVNQELGKRAATQLRNIAIRDEIVEALQSAHEVHAPWKALRPTEEIIGNVTKHLNVSCEDTFRLHLIFCDGGKILFPKGEAGDQFSASGSAEALHEITRRFALHRMPDEVVVVRRPMQAR
jgi:hypothetical protein